MTSNIEIRKATTTGDPELGRVMHDFMARLFPICRSITGEGVRETLSIIREILPELQIKSIKSGTQCFDWNIPLEWNIRSARLIDPSGKKIVDFADSNLHVLGYSVPIDTEIELQDLQEHLYSLPEQPDAIPYVTSYYRERWGFSLPHRLREQLKPGKYRAVIDSTLAPGELNYGELLISGESKDEIFVSTYVCHPSLANNELSGPVVATYLADWISSLKKRRYTYRIVFVPETIGSIAYISENLAALKQYVKAGFNLTCIGDDRAYSFLPSRQGDTLADTAVKHVLRHLDPEFRSYSFLDRGSDERQYCAPGVDLPVASIMRSKYGTYPEYHTSLDNLDVVTPSGLKGGYEAVRRSIELIEQNLTYQTTVLCEPQLGKRGLYSTIGQLPLEKVIQLRCDFLAYADGTKSLLEIAEILKVPVWDLYPHAEELQLHQLIRPIP